MATNILDIPKKDDSFITFNTINDVVIDESNTTFINREALFSLSLEVSNTSMTAVQDQ